MKSGYKYLERESLSNTKFQNSENKIVEVNMNKHHFGFVT